MALYDLSCGEVDQRTRDWTLSTSPKLPGCTSIQFRCEQMGVREEEQTEASKNNNIFNIPVYQYYGLFPDAAVNSMSSVSVSFAGSSTVKVPPGHLQMDDVSLGRRKLVG
jgi:hypothetical protein